MVRLFMVPDAAAGMRSGTACARARRSASTIRCEVSTFPPATDAIIVQKICCPVHARRHALQKLPHHFFGIIQQLARRLMRAQQAVAGANLAQAFSSGVAGSDLRAEVAFAFVRCAYVVEQ